MMRNALFQYIILYGLTSDINLLGIHNEIMLELKQSLQNILAEMILRKHT